MANVGFGHTPTLDVRRGPHPSQRQKGPPEGGLLPQLSEIRQRRFTSNFSAIRV
jgi:hypothetical protein